ncbi:uncharacterized protein ACBT44_009780 isoform 2-T10 [Syngnathus typhle]
MEGVLAFLGLQCAVSQPAQPVSFLAPFLPSFPSKPPSVRNGELAVTNFNGGDDRKLKPLSIAFEESTRHLLGKQSLCASILLTAHCTNFCFQDIMSDKRFFALNRVGSSVPLEVWNPRLELHATRSIHQTRDPLQSGIRFSRLMNPGHGSGKAQASRDFKY